MEYTDVSTWPEDHVRLYLTNDLKDRHNMASISRLLDQDAGRMLYTFYAIDSKRDSKTGVTQVNIDPSFTKLFESLCWCNSNVDPQYGSI